MEEQLKSIQKMLKEVVDHQKSYVDYKIMWEFIMGDKVFLWVRPIKSTINSTKLDPWFVDLFEIVEKKSLVTYKLALPPSL